MKKTCITSALLILLLTAVPLLSGVYPSRIAVFNDVISRAKKYKIERFSWYASRMLFVRHPELYLQADSLYAELMASTPGFFEMYTTGTRNRKKLKRLMQKYFKTGLGHPLQIRTLDLSVFKITRNKYLYKNQRIAAIPFLDERIAPLMSILKRANRRITSLESAFLHWFKHTQRGEKTWIVYTVKRQAYLYRNNRFYLHGQLLSQNPEEKIVAIFNDRLCFSPVLRRDDSKKPAEMRKLIRKLRFVKSLDLRSKVHNRIRDKILYQTSLRDKFDKIVASFAAGRYMGAILRTAAYKKRFTNPQIVDLVYKPMEIWVYNANLIHPFSWHFARRFHMEHNKRKRVIKTFRLYRRLFHTPGLGLQMSRKKKEPYINQSLWGYNGRFFIPGIEDNLLTKGGVCRDNSLIATAILDLMGIPHFHFCNKHHAMIWLPQWDYWYTNGVTPYIPKAGKWWNYKAFQKLLFTRIYKKGRGFNFFMRKGNTITTYPDKETVIVFTRALVKKIGKHTRMGCSKKNFLPAGKMLRRLQKKKFRQIMDLRSHMRFDMGEK